MDQEENKEIQENIDVLYEDDRYIFSQVHSFSAMKYYGVEWLSQQINKFYKYDFFVVYDKSLNVTYVILDDNNNLEFYNQNGDIVENGFNFFGNYPKVIDFIVEKTKFKNTYYFLMSVSNGFDPENLKLNKIDSLLYDIRFDKSDPKNSWLTISFYNSREYFESFDINQYDVEFAIDVMEYPGSVKLFEMDFAYDDWNEGYLIGYFDTKNTSKFKEILMILSPWLLTEEDEEHCNKYGSRLLYEEFYRYTDDIIEYYVELENECRVKDAETEIYQTSNELNSSGFHTIKPFKLYAVSLKRILKIYDDYSSVGSHTMNIQNLLKLLPTELGGWDDHRYDYNCKYSYNDEFNEYVSAKLDDILEEIDERFVDKKKYSEIVKFIEKKISIDNNFHQVPKNPKMLFKIKKVDPEDNTIHIKVTNESGEQVDRILNFEDLKLFLYHPELF